MDSLDDLPFDRGRQMHDSEERLARLYARRLEAYFETGEFRRDIEPCTPTQCAGSKL
jgi:hypothetical protein